LIIKSLKYFFHKFFCPKYFPSNFFEKKTKKAWQFHLAMRTFALAFEKQAKK